MRNGEPRFVAQRPWSDYDTDRLADLIAEGSSFQRAGNILGRTKNGCISRFHHAIIKPLGWQAA